MRETKECVVDGVRYHIEQLSTTQGLRIYNQLAHVLGDAINRELKAGGDPGERVVRMIVASLALIPEELQVSIGATFSKSCKTYVGEALMPLDVIYDDHFAGRFYHWTMWLLECLKVNFADFLERAKRAAPTETAEATPLQ